MSRQQGSMAKRHHKVVGTLVAPHLINTKEEATKNTEVKGNRLQ